MGFITLIAVPLFVTIVGAFLYGLMFRKYEDGFRRWLQDRKKGKLRAKYLEVFIGAVRGEAITWRAKTLGLVFMLIPGLLGSLCLYVSIVSFGRVVVLHDLEKIRSLGNEIHETGKDLDAIETPLKQLEEDTAALADAVQQAVQAVANNESRSDEEISLLAQEAKRVQEETTRIRQENDRIGKQAWRQREMNDKISEESSADDAQQLTFNKCNGFAMALCAVYWFAMILWTGLVTVPRTVYQHRFAFELSRFANRMQGLASKAELAELTKLEMAVRSEETARAYVDKMAAVARRYNVEELVDSFRLW